MRIIRLRIEDEGNNVRDKRGRLRNRHRHQQIPGDRSPLVGPVQGDQYAEKSVRDRENEDHSRGRRVRFFGKRLQSLHDIDDGRIVLY